MKILNKPIREITFDDIVKHCKEKYPEGVELDYKEKFPKKGLRKIIASFANKRGGLVIIGVKEDKKSGCPIKWEGVDEDAKLVERTYQEALNVNPPPSIDVCKTNVVSKKVFILVRVNEGDNTPYYIRNNANVWVRTGNISKSIDIASPEWLELLFYKRKQAKKARDNYLKLANEIYLNALKREEKIRNRLIEEAKKKGDRSEKNYYQKKLGTNVAMCTIAIQPYFPRKALIKPKEIIDKTNDYRFINNYTEFPKSNLEPIPEGALYFKHNYTGFIECQQIYASGLLFTSWNILIPDDNSGRLLLPINFIAAKLFAILKVARSFYKLAEYQGVIKGYISLDLKYQPVLFFREISLNGGFFVSDKEVLLPNYNWKFSLDTVLLNNEDTVFKFYFETLRDIYWSAGYKEISENVIKEFMKRNSMSFS